MSDKLRKLGIWSFEHKWRVLFGWVAVIAIMAGLVAEFSKPLSTEFSIPGTQSQEALEKLQKQNPNAEDGQGNIVFSIQPGGDITKYKKPIDEVLAKVKDTEGVAGVKSPFETKAFSRDGRTALANVQLNVKQPDVTQQLREDIQKGIESARAAGLQVEVSGDIIPMKETAEGTSEVIGIAVATVVLIITFGSMIAAGMPLLVGILSVGLGLLGINLAAGFVDISNVAPTLAAMLGLAVGIDYALFIISKHRKYLKEGIEPSLAIGRTISTAGNAVVFAAVTVIIALSALAITGVPFLSAMGIGAAFTVGIAALISLTLIPALLGFAKLRILRKKERKLALAHQKNPVHEDDKPHKKTFAYKWAAAITKQPIIVILIVVLGLGALAIPVRGLQLGLGGDGNAASDTTQRRAYELVSDGFGEGFNGPLIVVADLPDGQTPKDKETQIGSITQKLQKVNNVAMAMPGGVLPDGKTAIFQVFPKGGPNDESTKGVVRDIRNNSASIGDGATLAVTGQTAVNIDVDKKLADALPVYIAVVLGLSLIILVMVFRSIIIPIKATLGFLLTLGSMFGALIIFFQWGQFDIFPPGPILSFLPILVTGILFGLAMDYEFFLVSSMQEEFHRTKDAKKSVVEGFGHAAKVVTAAGVIMTAVFAGFIFMPDPVTQSIGFALAVGILVDAFLVRMTLVPAVMAMTGKAAWWIPKWLDKILPNISIEGATEEQLEKVEDLDQMQRAELMLTLNRDMTNINRLKRLGNKETVKLSLSLDNLILTTGLEHHATVNTLTQLLAIEEASTNKQLSQLVQKGLVLVTPGKPDESPHVHLTPEGRLIYREVLLNQARDMGRLLRPLTDDDLRSLTKVIRKLKRGLET